MRRLGLGAVSLVVANVLLLQLYFMYDITLFQLVLVYWCECVWIGLFSGIKLVLASLLGDPFENRFADVSRGTSLMMSVFVIFLTGTVFFSIIGMMLMFILSANESLELSNRNDAVYNHISLVVGASLLLMAGHAVSLIGNFFVLGEYKTARAWPLLLLPFKRCFALFVAIVFSIAFIALTPQLANTSAFAVVVIVLKVFWDVELHRRERRALRESPA